MPETTDTPRWIAAILSWPWLLPVARIALSSAFLIGGIQKLAALVRSFPHCGNSRLGVVVHKIIAVRDYVFAHVNFLNLVTDSPTDTGIAGVDIYRFDNEGKAVEHWDTLQVVGHPANSAPWIAPNIPRANPQGMF